MIIYFSGTGNSEYVANEIAKAINDETLNLFERIRNKDHSSLTSMRPWIIVVPTYAWRIPQIVNDWLLKTKLEGHCDIYFIMTCAGSIGNADKYLKQLCGYKQMEYKGSYQVIMPENYVALFEAPDKAEAISIVEKAKPQIKYIIESIQNNIPHLKSSNSLKDRLSSGIVNTAFYYLFVHAKKFYVTDACIKCGKCEKLCPLKNISLKQGKPLWSNECTHCMACINRCPKAAIEYGKHTQGKPRYVCPK